MTHDRKTTIQPESTENALPILTPGRMRALTRAFTEKLFEDVRRMSVTKGPEGKPLESEGVTRTAYSDEETAVLDHLEAIARDWGLEVRTDPVGNRFFTYAGEDRTLPALMSGSHADSVLSGGNFDGLAGIAAAFAAVAAWRALGLRPKRDFTIAAFRAEEPGLLGTEALFGRMKPESLTRRIDPWPGALVFGELVKRQGLDPQRLVSGEVFLDRGSVDAFLELHIEQAPSLAADDVVRTGLVTGIRGRIAYDVIEVVGDAAHAGAIERAYRRDAVAASAEVVHRMNAWWAERLAAGDDLVLTFGVFATPEDAVFNKIAGDVRLSFEARSLEVEVREAAARKLLDTFREVEAETGVAFRPQAASRLEPQLSDEGLLSALADAARRTGVPVRRMASGAGHDAQNFGVAGIPFAMIFVANDHGSHNPREAMTLNDFEAGAALLADAGLRW